jgi:hypothetical protein
MQSILITLFLFAGGAALLVAVVLAVWTNQGWPKMTLSALALLVVAGFLISRELRSRS